MCEFSRDDVIKMAKALRSDNNSEIIGEDSRDYARIYCNHCSAYVEMPGWFGRFDPKEAPTWEDVKHDIDCPVSVAKDVLTRIDAT